MKAVDLNSSSRDLLAPLCRSCLWWQSARARVQPGASDARRSWEEAVEATTGFFGRALLDDDEVLGWMHVAPAGLVPRAARLPAGPPSADAHLLLCSYFYDEEYLNGFQRLLHEVESALKARGATALEAFAARHQHADEPLRGYVREMNLFRPEVLEGNGFRPLRRTAEITRYRLDLKTLVPAARLSRARKEREAGPAVQPV